MRILVTGARGQLGRACLEVLTAAGFDTVGVDLPDSDLTQPGVADRELARHRPDRVIHAAAYTAVDRAETERDLALAVNATATALVAAACRDHGCALTYISTDYVFAGDCAEGYLEDAPPDPLNWYGVTKARGEAAIRQAGGSWQIVRTSWLFGHGPANFVRTVYRRLRRREALNVVADQRGCPTYALDLAELLKDLAVAEGVGIYHGTNSGVCSWYELAQAVAAAGGFDVELVRPCATADYPTAARRPACSVLRDSRLATLGLAPRPAWRDAVTRYVGWLQANEEASEHD
ncbi:MAG: dTDP-4-dehydrorhamnose reductase [Candidatus Krumholzibacteria bacterium]|jgi:dTDP-4-dehydrorhamnose reductase|nr:dTDP-4-dehydrorhamnose reductase [Candidatus Krumholzibacteria bacterium]